MTDPIPVQDAIRACERLIAICDAATPEKWIGFGLEGGAPTIATEANDTLFNVRGWGFLTGYQGLSEAEAMAQQGANMGLVLAARATLKPLAELALEELRSFAPNAREGSFSRYAVFSLSLYPAVAAIVAHLDSTEPNWRTK